MQPSVFPKELPVNKTEENKQSSSTLPLPRIGLSSLFSSSRSRCPLFRPTVSPAGLRFRHWFFFYPCFPYLFVLGKLPEVLYFFFGSNVNYAKILFSVFHSLDSFNDRAEQDLNIAVSIFFLVTSTIMGKMASSFSPVSSWLSDSINSNQPGLDIVSVRLHRSKRQHNVVSQNRALLATPSCVLTCF